MIMKKTFDVAFDRVLKNGRVIPSVWPMVVKDAEDDKTGSDKEKGSKKDRNEDKAKELVLANCKDTVRFKGVEEKENV